MELGIHEIIKGVVITPKSAKLYQTLGKITFSVHRVANKLMVRNAVEKIWEVKVDAVHIINLPGKTRRHAGRLFKSSGKRKAIITLKSGYKIDLPGHGDSAELVSTSSKSEEEGN